MPTLVEVPGQGQIEFPDGMSDEQIAGAIHQNYPDLKPPEPATVPAAFLAPQTIDAVHAPILNRKGEVIPPEPEKTEMQKVAESVPVLSIEKPVKPFTKGNVGYTGMFEPIIELPQYTNPTTIKQGIYNLGAEAVSAATSPAAILAGPISKVPGGMALVRAGAGVLGVKGMHDVLGALQTSPPKTAGEMVQRSGELLLSGTMAVGSFAEPLIPETTKALKGEPNAIKERQQPESNQLQHSGDDTQRPPSRPSDSGGVTPSPAQEGQASAQAQPEQLAANPTEVGKEIGFDYKPGRQIGAFKLEGLTPEERAKLDSVQPVQWEFTNPKTGITFYTKEGATRQEIIDAAKAKESGGPPPASPVESSAELPPEGKMRKSAARASVSETFPEPVRETIKTAPESFYKQQSTKEVASTISSMAESDLAAVPKTSDIYVASKLEQAKRLFNEGKDDAGYQVFVELEKEGTRLGQLINQFKFLDSVNPNAVVKIIDKRLVGKGYDPLTKPQSEKVIETTKQSQEATSRLEKAKDEWVKNPTPENAAKADAVLDESNKAELAVQKLVHKYEPKSIAGTLSTIMKGGMLTSISEVANIGSNINFLPFRAGHRQVGAVIDMIDSYVRSRPREITTQPIAATVEALKGAGRGIAQIPAILKYGAGDVLKGERATALRPVRAWIDMFSKNPDVPTIGGKIPFSDRIRMALEGTFGVPAEAMLRGLAAGDRPFRESAQARIIANEAKLAGVPRAKWSMAQKFPDLFFDKKTLERIEGETLEAIFQRRSNTIRYIMKLFNSRGPWAEFAGSTIAPYKLTPWNVIAETLSYNPVVALARSAYEAKAGNSRAAKLNAGKFVVGSMLTAAGYWLYNKGLLAPSMDQPDEQMKARILANQVLPPNHINVSGLDRALKGGDPAFKPGDTTMNVFRAGGLAGSMFYMTANIGRDMEKQPESGADPLMSILRNSTIEQVRFGFNQSFLQGVGGLFEAIRGGDVDNYVRQWAGTVMSIPLPNTLNTLSRATRPSKIEVDSFGDLLKSRLGVYGTDELMATKRGLWGEPIPETPEGRNAILYHFFDITKAQQVTSDPVAIELYKLWRTSNNATVIPTPVGKTVTVAKETYALTPEQRTRFAELVGQNRRQLAQAMIDNPNWNDLEDEQKLDVLRDVYQKGMDAGKAVFLSESPKLEPKKKAAGFKP